MAGFECVFQLLTSHYLFTHMKTAKQQREGILVILIAAVYVTHGHIHKIDSTLVGP